MKKRISRKKPKWQLDIAKERIEILFKQAEKEFKKHPELSDRYVEIARKIGMKFNVPVPRALKRRFCNKCYIYLFSGKNARTRIRSEKKYVLITCLKCGNKMRYPYINEKKQQQKL